MKQRLFALLLDLFVAATLVTISAAAEPVYVNHWCSACGCNHDMEVTLYKQSTNGTYHELKFTCPSKGSYTIAQESCAYTFVDATCYQARHCTVCGYEDPNHPATGIHDWSKCDGKCATPGCTATCDSTSNENHDHACDICGKPLTTCADNLTPVNGQAASCNDGWKDYYTCSICGKIYSDANATDEITDLVAWKAGKGKIPAAHVGKTHKEYDPIFNSSTGEYDLNNHTVTTACDTCGAPLSAKQGAHNWAEGVCSICGLACPHSGSDDANCNTAVVCDICGEELTQAQSHWFSQWKPCSDGYHAAYCIREGCNGAAGLPCEWFDLTFTTSDEEEKTISICPVCGAVRHEDSALEAVTSATVKAGAAGLPRGELIVRGMENPYGGCLYAFTVGYEYSGWLEAFLDKVTVTIPVELEGDFRLVYVEETLEGQTLTEAEYAYDNGCLTFETEKQGIFLILPVSE